MKMFNTEHKEITPFLEGGRNPLLKNLNAEGEEKEHVFIMAHKKKNQQQTGSTAEMIAVA